MNAYNALKMLGQKSIEKEGRKKLKRKRLGKVIRDLICVAGKLVKHGRELIFKINEKDPMLPVFLRIQAIFSESNFSLISFVKFCNFVMKCPIKRYIR